MTESVHGSCACGNVTFEVDLPPRFVCHCHCENCRRAHGAAFVTWSGFPDGRWRIRSGEDRLLRWQTDTGATRSFCGTCGTTLFFSSPRWPGEIHATVANLDAPLLTQPAAHVYADRAPDWCPITDTLPRCGGESGMEPLDPDTLGG